MRGLFLCWAQQVAHLSLKQLGDTDGILEREPLLLNEKREWVQAVGLSAEVGMGGHCNIWLHVTIITEHIRDPHTQLHSPFMHREIELIKLIRIRQKELCQDAYTHIYIEKKERGYAGLWYSSLHETHYIILGSPLGKITSHPEIIQLKVTFP